MKLYYKTIFLIFVLYISQADFEKSYSYGNEFTKIPSSEDFFVAGKVVVFKWVGEIFYKTLKKKVLICFG